MSWLYRVYSMMFLLLITAQAGAAKRPPKPTLIAEASGDTAAAQNALALFFGWGQTVMIICGVASVIAGGVISVPIIGKADRGKSYILGGFFAIIVGVAAEFILGGLGEIWG